jgi:pimeloyl-ACP methyl ester carboxylesterase
MKLARVSFPAATVTLAGLTYSPDNANRPTSIVLSHGYTASKESMDLMAAYLCSRGYSCLTYDFRGHKLGGSTGELTDMKDAIEDATSAAGFAMSRFGTERCVLVGHSMGALVSFAAAAQMSEVAGVAAVAVGPHPSQGFRSPAGAAMLAQRSDYVAGLEPMRLLEQFDGLVPVIGQIGDRPTLFVAAKADVLVKVERMRELAAMAGPRAEFAEVEGGHLDAPDRARGVVAGWLDRTFPGEKRV